MKLLFDFGGVLVDLDRERVVNAFAELGLDMHNYLRAYRQSGPFSLLEQGKISIHEFCNEIRNLTGHTELTDESIVKAWGAFLARCAGRTIGNAAENQTALLGELAQQHERHSLATGVRRLFPLPRPGGK